MALFEFENDSLTAVPPTDFFTIGLRERQDIQRVLRRNIASITPGVETMVLAEEYCDWADAKRRIDLLCLDSEMNLVVIELKRTDSGGHSDLQALRYAAMVAPMKFEQAVDAHRAYLAGLGEDSDGAEQSIRRFLGVEDETIVFTDTVRIVLASADFSKELTTTVLWLNSRGRLDIRCVQMRPISFAGRILFDVEQVIPLPAAAEYTVAIREKTLEKESAASSGKDYTRFDLVIGSVSFANLPKRRFIYHVVAEALRLGLSPDAVRNSIPWKPASMFIAAEGKVSGTELLATADADGRNYFIRDEELFFVNKNTYALTNQWGKRTQEAVDNIITVLPPNHEVSYKTC